MFNFINEMASYYGTVKNFKVSASLITVRSEGNHSMPHMHIYVKSGEPSVNVEIKLLTETDELNILTKSTLNKTSWNGKIAKEIKRMLMDKDVVDILLKDYKGISHLTATNEEFNFTEVKYPITTIGKLLMDDHKHSEYWFDKSKDLRIGCNYDISDKFGNNTLMIYKKGYNEVLIFQYHYLKDEIILLFSSFSDEMDKYLVSLIKDNYDRKIFRDLISSYLNSLRLINKVNKII